LSCRGKEATLGKIGEYSLLTLLPHLSLQKMLMKQQDRLEEREQDIEDQLYKLESDKRLVEVVEPEPGGSGAGGGGVWRGVWRDGGGNQASGNFLLKGLLGGSMPEPSVSHSVNCQRMSLTGRGGWHRPSAASGELAHGASGLWVPDSSIWEGTG
jgi:hypothetical protein